MMLIALRFDVTTFLEVAKSGLCSSRLRHIWIHMVYFMVSVMTSRDKSCSFYERFEGPG